MGLQEGRGRYEEVVELGEVSYDEEEGNEEGRVASTSRSRSRGRERVPYGRRKEGRVWDWVRELSWRDPRTALAGLCLALLVVVALETLVVTIFAGVNGGRGGGSVVLEPERSLHEDYEGRSRVVRGGSGVVAADQGDCSEQGARALRAGGHAVDAAVATAFCLGVKNPFASGIGGGAFILVRLADGTAEAIDAREPAPALATERMFVGDPKKALEGGLAVAVPMEILGLHRAWERHGRLPWKDLVMPAAELAKGFAAHPYLVRSVERHRDAMEKFPDLGKIFMPRGRAPRVGETCCGRPRLSKTLEEIAINGPRVLYEGELARGLARDVQEAGGILTTGDLEQAKPRNLEVLEAEVMGMRVVTLPPPSSGAVVVSILKQIEARGFPVTTSGALGKHWLVEAMKNSFAARMSLGDPGTKSDPFLDAAKIEGVVEDLVSPKFAKSLVDATLDYGVRPAEEYGGIHGPFYVPDDNGTSHLSIVDADQNAVSMTTTINTGFGSKLVSRSTGILLNNEMDDFSIPGQPNTYGLAPSEANYVRGGKKPLSSMSPIIASGMDDGGLKIVLGGSGGPRIITAIAETFLGYVDRRLSPSDALQEPRLHHQLFPEDLLYENETSREIMTQLPLFGHRLKHENGGLGNCQMVVMENGTAVAVSDHRKDGAPSKVDDDKLQ
ncbi:gamma-glutamyl transpeptidase [Chloropicon primus]|uniref:Glutathione hydrolase n=3 Tax=Chloropicon primus TaxID=1764295 RepID=A0A5B8MNJ6_9CHLO|nr:gamma-glutamyl transpeptidase [Chloropicon primus]UPR00329.1 gamma-glutamyl transpeptidase [Chloropicon primus]|eukprot:QDZ21115.1 gamma-glutamyl transpeptidase [Chloropicon primus]